MKNHPPVLAKDDVRRMYKELLDEKASSAGLPERVTITGGLDSYELQRLLGQGGEGAVFLAKRERDSCSVVLKRRTALSLPEANRCINEALAMSRIESGSPFVARFDEIFITQEEEGGTTFWYFWLVLGYASGGDLSQLIVESAAGGEVVGLDVFRARLRHILSGVAAVHEAGVVHADIKPENILVHAGVLQVGDFGMATTPGSSEGGSYFYDPPEESWSFAGDLFSVGLVALDMARNRLQGVEAQRAGLPSIGEVARKDPAWTPSLLLLQLPEHLTSAASLLFDMLSRDPVSRTPAKVLLQDPFFTRQHRASFVERSSLVVGFSLRMYSEADKEPLARFLTTLLPRMPQYEWAFRGLNVSPKEMEYLFERMSSPVLAWALAINTGYVLWEPGDPVRCVGFSLFLPPNSEKELPLKYLGTVNALKLLSSAPARELSLWNRWVRSKTTQFFRGEPYWYVWGLYAPDASSRLDFAHERELLHVAVDLAISQQQRCVVHAFSERQMNILKQVGFRSVKALKSTKWPSAPTAYILVHENTGTEASFASHSSMESTTEEPGE